MLTPGTGDSVGTKAHAPCAFDGMLVFVLGIECIEYYISFCRPSLLVEGANETPSEKEEGENCASCYFSHFLGLDSDLAIQQFFRHKVWGIVIRSIRSIWGKVKEHNRSLASVSPWRPR